MSQPSARRAVVPFLGAALVVQSAYLGVTASPDPFYVANVLLHHYGGLLLALLLVAPVRRALADRSRPGRGVGIAATALGTLAVGTAIALEIVHNTAPHRWLLLTHIALAIACVLCAVAALGAAAKRSGSAAAAGRWLRAGVVAALLVAVAGGAMQRRVDARSRIVNPERPPLDMAGESMGGASGPFFPSSAATSTGGRIPSDFFMTSESCRRCHEDIYEQWNGSAHHFSSFNNQWYRKSIEYQQEVGAIAPTKWCGGCHDHAVLFNGMMDGTVDTFLETQEAHTGVGCNSCHAVTHVKGTMGNGSFFLDYPPLHDLAVSGNPLLRWLHDKAVALDPGPHKRVFLKPFHRDQTAEFCSSCHKVHLDKPINSYRWLRGFNEYDNWQASGVSGQGARSFYYPAEPRDCADCHMELVPSDDKGNIDGFVHDHAFPAANTALPAANLRGEQLAKVIEFLQRQQVTVDILAAGPARPLGAAAEAAGVAGGEPQLASTFAIGEEAAMSVGRGGNGGSGGGASREPAPLWGPLNRTPVTVRRGEDVRVDVVVRTRGVGHFFPGGTIDAFDVWLELRAVDDTGRTIFWSGIAADNGEGAVDEGAHFYGARMVDAHGNPINKRNAFATRAVAWVNLIPPGAADVAHYRLTIPPDCGDTMHLEARLNYRKFTTYNTAFSFAGAVAPGEPAGPDDPTRVTAAFDDREFVFGEVPANVSAELREIPVLPIVVMDRAEATLRVVDARADAANAVVPVAEDFLRWNDYGIGLLRQGDLSAAKRAFTMVTELRPDYADGFVNVGRAALQEGLLEEAADALGRAAAVDPDLAKIQYFLGVAAKEKGDYPEALERFRLAAAAYPRDRVVRNAIARVLFLRRRFDDAILELQRVLAIDAEDLMAHYNLMLCYRGLGRLEDAEYERALYERFKADEDANAILGPYLRDHPGDNRMRQPIHEQVSAPRGLIDRETERRRDEGEPHVVLPGEAARYAERVCAAGEAALETRAANRIAGPVEAGVVRPAGVRTEGTR